MLVYGNLYAARWYENVANGSTDRWSRCVSGMKNWYKWEGELRNDMEHRKLTQQTTKHSNNKRFNKAFPGRL